MSELRLYCNLLVQQVHKTKEASISGVSEPEVQLCFCCRSRVEWLANAVLLQLLNIAPSFCREPVGNNVPKQQFLFKRSNIVLLQITSPVLG